MQQNSRIVETNQSGPHEKLEATVRRHVASSFKKPFAEHTLAAFELVNAKVQADGRPLIVDSCCGVGDSSRYLSSLHPDHLVVGIDKSASRLGRERQDGARDNLILMRADLNDFYRLAQEAGWKPAYHFILYPNPWPKAEHLKKRWHGAPIFPNLVALGGQLELRSNWKLYLKEFQIALGLLGIESRLAEYRPGVCITPFEAKYHDSGQPLWQLKTV